MWRRALAGLTLVLLSCAPPHTSTSWSTIFSGLAGALVSVGGTSATDVWAIGGDPGDGNGPFVLHFDGTSWKKLKTGSHGDLWWLHAFPNGPVFMGGAGGVILKYESGTFTQLTTPGTDTVFGIWGSSPTSLWAVGGDSGLSAFAWRYDGSRWSPAAGFPADLHATNTLYKVWGTSDTDVWLVGGLGLVLHFDGVTFTNTSPITGADKPLFTVHGANGRVGTVGGFVNGLVLENSGGSWKDVSPQAAMTLSGIHLVGDDGYAVGERGTVRRRNGGAWSIEDTGLKVSRDFHAVWVDPSGGVWAVGGQVLSGPLIDGVMIHKGASIPSGTFSQ